MDSPCLTCGACCAGLRVQFHADHVAPRGRVPRELVIPAKARDHVLLRGTPEGRCAALAGEVGCGVQCTVYELRPPPCRDFAYSGHDGVHHEACDQARAAHGLPPLPVPAPTAA